MSTFFFFARLLANAILPFGPANVAWAGCDAARDTPTKAAAKTPTSSLTLLIATAAPAILTASSSRFISFLLPALVTRWVMYGSRGKLARVPNAALTRHTIARISGVPDANLAARRCDRHVRRERRHAVGVPFHL